MLGLGLRGCGERPFTIAHPAAGVTRVILLSTNMPHARSAAHFARHEGRSIGGEERTLSSHGAVGLRRQPTLAYRAIIRHHTRLKWVALDTHYVPRSGALNSSRLFTDLSMIK
jgi:hypothetical protein